MINPHVLPGNVGPFVVRRAVLTPRSRRGHIVSFDAATWKASVQLDGALAALNIKVADWVNPSVLTAGKLVCVVLFNDSNPDDGLVIGTYGTVGGPANTFSDAEGNPAPLGVAAPGTSTYSPRRDHVHLDPVPAHEAAYAHADIAGHIADAADAHDASAISILDTAADFTATDVEGALAELQADAEAHAAAADPHTGYVLESLIDAAGDLIQGSAADTVARLAISIPAANILNVLGVANGETVASWKPIHDATNPAALGTAAPGTSLLASHRDHVHLDPVTAHVAAGDPHTGYRLETADHSHASAGAQGGTILLSDTVVSGLTDGQVHKATGAATHGWEDDVAAIEFIIDGGGSAITTGQKGHLEIPFACVIQRVTTLADQTGSIVVDIWKDTYANFPPADADSITSATPPTLAAAQKAQDATLASWITTVAAGDILAYNVDSAATVTRVVISLKVRKT